jgi:hypothetical protein
VSLAPAAPPRRGDSLGGLRHRVAVEAVYEFPAPLGRPEAGAILIPRKDRRGENTDAFKVGARRRGSVLGCLEGPQGSGRVCTCARRPSHRRPPPLDRRLTTQHVITANQAEQLWRALARKAGGGAKGGSANEGGAKEEGGAKGGSGAKGGGGGKESGAKEGGGAPRG